MQEENSINEQNANEWQAPPPPENIPEIETEPAQMSEAATLGNIFFDPGNTFEDLRRKPRFIMALLIMIILTTAFSFAFYYRVGEDNFRRYVAEQIDKNPQTQGLSAEKKNEGIDLNMKISNGIRYALPVIILLFTALGALLYWLGAKAFGGRGSFWHALSVWVYASFPPAVISTLANFIILFLKSIDEIDIGTGSQRGLVQANPSFLIDGKSMPVLSTIVASTLDLFLIWGWILAAIGLRITNKISTGSAWAIVLILALIQIAFRVLGASFSGNPS